MLDKILKRFEDDLYQSSPRTARARVTDAQRFLAFAGPPPWNRQTVIRYIRHLEKQDYAPGTIRLEYSIVKRVFDAAKAIHEEDQRAFIFSVDPNNPSAVAEIIKALSAPPPTWDMGKRGAPKVAAKDVVAPALTAEEIQTMVETAKAGRLEDDEVAFLAVSTTYGLRREEMVRIEPEHFDWGEKTIYILTCKGGDERLHLIPEEIIPWLAGHDFSKRYSLFALSKMYRQIEAKSGIGHREGAGWHSPRRQLDTMLMDILPMPQVKTFLRWKTRSSSEMPMRYYSAGLERLERAVFSVHPFVPFWADRG